MSELTPRDEQGERGIALVAALWFSVAVAGIAASFAVLARGETMRSRNMVDDIRAHAILEAALERAVSELTNPTVRPAPNGTHVVWTFDGAGIVIDITGESGKIDLNHVDNKFISQLVQELGYDRELGDRVGDAIVDWRDPNSLRQPKGAEDRDYRVADRPAGAADAPFASVTELRDVLPVTPELYRAMRGFFTVATGEGRPKLELASPVVRRAALGAGPPDSNDQENANGDTGNGNSSSGDGTNEQSFTSQEYDQAKASGNDPGDPSEGGGVEIGDQREASTDMPTDANRPRRSAGFSDPADLYSVRLDIRLVDGFEAHADALVWLRDAPDGRPYLLLNWEPSPLRGEQGS